MLEDAGLLKLLTSDAAFAQVVVRGGKGSSEPSPKMPWYPREAASHLGSGQAEEVGNGLSRAGDTVALLCAVTPFPLPSRCSRCTAQNKHAVGYRAGTGVDELT